jgi:hypothetical protein
MKLHVSLDCATTGNFGPNLGRVLECACITASNESSLFLQYDDGHSS